MSSVETGLNNGGLGKERRMLANTGLNFWRLVLGANTVALACFGSATLTRQLHPRPAAMAPPKSSPATSKTAAPAAADASPATSVAVQSLWKAYNETTSPRLKFIDAFLVFLMVSGILQFVYCVLVTNFPFNAFLAGYAYFSCEECSGLNSVLKCW